MAFLSSNGPAEIKLEERDGSKLVAVRLDGHLNREDERWFWQYLDNADGVAYIEVEKDTGRLAGYGVWEMFWNNFRFWLEVTIYDSFEKEGGEYGG